MNRARRRRWVVLVAVILLAFGLRLLRLDASPLRGDEAFAIQYWAAPWPGGLALASVEPHPYGTFAVFALWKGLLGESEWAMRLLPALGNLPGLAAAYVLGRRLFRMERAGLLAALLYAVHPGLIWHAQDARNYALWASATPVAAAALLVALDGRRVRHWLRYGLAVVLSVYVFFFASFFVVGHGFYVLLFRRDRLREWLVVVLGSAVLAIPLGLQVLSIMQGGGYAGTAGRFVVGQLLTWFLPVLVVGDTLPVVVLEQLWVVLLPLVVLGLVGVVRWRPRAGGFLLVDVVLPVVLLWVVCVWLDVFRPRYLLPVSVGFVVLLAGVVGLLTTRKVYFRASGAVILCTVFLLNGWALANYYLDPAFVKAPDWRTLGAFMTAETQANELVIQQALDPAFTYYFRGPAAETTLPLRANAPAEETIAYLENASQQYRRLWLIPADVPHYDPEHVPLAWLTSEMQTTADLTVAGFRVLQFQPWVVDEAEYSSSVNAHFSDIAVLLDWHLDQLGPSTLRLIVYWEPLKEPGRILHGFVHLVGPPHPDTAHPLWAQDDHPVTNMHWQAGTIRRDVYLLSLPDALPTADWELHVGLYDPTTLQRVPVSGDDHITIELGITPLAPIP